MATQQGTMALLFGVPDLGTITLGSTALVGAIVVSEVGMTPTAQEVRSPDENGNTINITTFDQGMEVTLVCKPRGAGAAAIADSATANNYFPAIGDKCTILQAAGTVTRYKDNAFSKATTGWSYRVKSASKNTAPGQPVTWNLTLERLDSISDMTPLT